jgi:hypothetical protein|nr:cyclic nucleotide-binding domain-containing protein [Kofleriaceae bacterium]
MSTRRPPTIQIPPKRAHSETRGRLPLIESTESEDPSDPAVAAVLSGDKTPLPAPMPHHVADPTLPNKISVPPPTPTLFPKTPPLGISPAFATDPDAATTLRAMETADTSDLDISTEDTAPQDPARAAAMAGAALLPTQDAGEGPFFAPLPADRRAAVLARFYRRQLAPGMLVIRQGETKHPLYLVARGLLEVRTERANGDLITLEHVRDNDVVGEIGLLTQSPSPFQVIAATPVEVYALGPKDFYDIVGAFPALWSYLKDLADRRARSYDAKLKR